MFTIQCDIEYISPDEKMDLHKFAPSKYLADI